MEKTTNFQKVKTLIGWPILFLVGQLFILFLLIAILQFVKPISFTEFELADRLRTVLFPSTVITFCIFYPIFSHKYQKEKIHSVALRKNKILYYVLFGVLTSFVIHIFFLNLERVLPIPATLSSTSVTYDWFYIGRVFSTALIGPILEEYLFRGFLYQEAKKWMKPMRAILLITLIFVLCHTTVYSFLAAIVISFIVIDALEKEKSITAPILFHMFYNLIAITIIPLIARYQMYQLDIIFIVMLVCFVVLYLINKPTKFPKK